MLTVTLSKTTFFDSMGELMLFHDLHQVGWSKVLEREINVFNGDLACIVQLLSLPYKYGHYFGKCKRNIQVLQVQSIEPLLSRNMFLLKETFLHYVLPFVNYFFLFGKKNLFQLLPASEPEYPLLLYLIITLKTLNF